MSRFAMRPLLSISVLCSPGAASLATAQELQREPSAVLHDVAKGRLEHLDFTPDQVEAALKPLLANMRSANLSPEEEVARGLAYFFTFDGQTAKPLLEKAMDRDDFAGRVSWQALQNMSYFGAKDYALVEKRVTEFRRKFRPILEDLEYSGTMVNLAASHRASAGEHAMAVSMILEDLQALPLNAPFRSYENLGRHFASFRAVGRQADALELMTKHRDAMRLRLRTEAALPVDALQRDPLAATQAPHRSGTPHYFPFVDGLGNDDPEYSRDRANAIATARSVDLFSRIIDAVTRGVPIPRR
jgi:hypothetical protein